MKYLIYVLFILGSVESFAQCSGGINGGSITPTTTWQTVNVLAGRYYTFTVAAGTCDTYDFSFCQGGGTASYDTQITLRTNTDVYAGAYNDDFCGLQSQVLAFSPTGAGTYRVLINNYNCASSGASATLAFKKNSPNTNSNYIYLNNASATGNCITLTPAANAQTGCAWDVNSTLNFASNFSFDFTVNLGSNDAGADGMAFVMQNDPAGLCKCGVSGGSLGAGGILNSVIIEIDTYLNMEDRDDGMPTVVCAGGPDPDHIDLWLNGNVNPYADCSFQPPGARVIPNAVRLMNAGSPYNIENGANHILRISWNSGTSTLTASVMNTALTITYATLSYSFNPITVFGTNTPYFGFTASTGGLNNQQTYCLPNVLLPVEIISFNGKCSNDKSIINWTSIAETDNDYYYIERSNDGINYSTIKVIDGAENSNQLIEYSFVDDKPLSGTNYYRLSQTNLNGVTKIIGEPIALNCTNEITDILIFPNPTEDFLTIDFKQTILENASARIYDITGKLIFSEKKKEDSQNMILNLSEISSGSYILVIENEYTVVFQQKLMVAH